MKKTVTVLIPTLNEQENVIPCYERVTDIFEKTIPEYELNILFIDNYSTDKTRELIEQLCKKDNRVQAIFNAKNYGYARSSFYGLISSQGDATILLHCDMQDPPEVIPEMIEKWESGYKVVCGQKKSNAEGIIAEHFRKRYYRLLNNINEYGHIEQFNGFGLYDSSFIKILADINDPLPYLRGMVAELAPNIAIVKYDHQKRERGKSNFSISKMIDYSLLGITSTSKIAMRMASLIGMILAVISILIAMITFIVKITHWNTYPVGMAATIIGIFFIGAIQLIFIGILGEYVTNMNIRILNRPLIIEERRINMCPIEKGHKVIVTSEDNK